MHQRVDQLFACGGIVPVTRRLAGRRVVVITLQRRPHPRRQRRRQVVQHHQQLADRGPQLGHGVLGGHRVIQRSGVQHPGPALHGARFAGHHLGVLEQAPRPRRGSQPVALADQHRRMKRLRPGVDPGRRLPPQIDLEPIRRLPIRQALMRLQHHDRGQHPRRHRRPPPRRGRVEVREVVVREQAITEVRQQPVDRPLPQPVTQDLPRVLEPLLHHRHTQRHPPSLFSRDSPAVDTRPTTSAAS